jgi:outer membrane protein TolC
VDDVGRFDVSRAGVRAACVLALLTAVPACYERRAVDARAVLARLRQGHPDARAGAGPSAAEGTAAGTLGESRAVALALVHNPELRAFRLERGVAEGQVVAAGALANPELRLELTHLQNGPDLGWGVGLAWEPPQPTVLSARKAAARAHRDEVDDAIAAREWELASDVRDAYAVLLAADEAAQLTAEATGVRDKLRAAVEGRVGHGAATRFDADLAAIAVADAERASAEAAIAQREARRSLARLVGLQPDAPVAVAPPAGDVGDAPAPACAGLDDRAIASRRSVAGALAHHAAVDETVRLEHARRWPWFKFIALPRVRRNEFFGNETDYVLGIELTLPLLNWNTGAIAAAEAARDRAEADVVATVDRVRRDVAAACAEVAAQRDLLRLQREQLLPLLQEHDRLMNQALRAHEVELTAIIVSEGRVLDTRIALVRRKLALRRAQIALERAVGEQLDPSGSGQGAGRTGPAIGSSLP